MTVKKTDYKKLTNELESLVEQLQNGKLDIDDATEAYEKGMMLIEQLEAYLKSAENKIIKIKKQFGS